MDGAPRPLDEDPSLDELFGVRGSLALRTMLHDFPQPVGLLWAVPDANGRIVDFEFGYGNPRILEQFAFPESQRGRYALPEAMPQLREDGTFETYARVCETGEPFVDEITFDTPFGYGYARGKGWATSRPTRASCVCCARAPSARAGSSTPCSATRARASCAAAGWPSTA